MRLDKLTKKYPVIASLAIILIATTVTEVPVDPIRHLLSPAAGRFYGDYLCDLILSALCAVCLVLAAPLLGLGGKLGLRKPHPWRSLLLTWPLVSLAMLSGAEFLSPDMQLSFDPLLFLIFLPLYLAIGFFEEVLFRGYVQGFLMRRWGQSYRGMQSSVLLAALIFAAMHFTNLSPDAVHLSTPQASSSIPSALAFISPPCTLGRARYIRESACT